MHNNIMHMHILILKSLCRDWFLIEIYDRLNLKRPKFPEAITFEPRVQITHNAHISDYNISS